MNVLFIVDHAPDYREVFFRRLGEQCNLTVLAHPCEPDGLSSPDERLGYSYVQIPLRKAGPFFLKTQKLPVRFSDFDVLCVDFNPRHIWRIGLFLRNRSLWKNWLWWGHIYGRSENIFLKKIRSFVLVRAAAVLVYSKRIAEKINKKLPEKPIISINNTQAQEADFMNLEWPESEQLHFIFVGRPQERKRLDRIVALAERFPFTRWRLIGPGMNEFMRTRHNPLPDTIEIFGQTTGNELIEHFEWCHAVVNPGHLGLLVSNAAIHGRPILIQKNEIHAPEIVLAEEADQTFIDFDSKEETERFFNKLIEDSTPLKKEGYRLQKTAKENYTIEKMVEKHIEGFKYVIRSTSDLS
jgi:glycosyltransferase involved in cell wall biosynthesis